jgi:hypothetical protein
MNRTSMPVYFGAHVSVSVPWPSGRRYYTEPFQFAGNRNIRMSREKSSPSARCRSLFLGIQPNRLKEWSSSGRKAVVSACEAENELLGVFDSHRGSAFVLLCGLFAVRAH